MTAAYQTLLENPVLLGRFCLIYRNFGHSDKDSRQHVYQSALAQNMPVANNTYHQRLMLDIGVTKKQALIPGIAGLSKNVSTYVKLIQQ